MKLATAIRRGFLLALIAISCGSVYPAIHAQSTNVSPVAPTRQQVEAIVKEAYEKFRGDTGGKNADYIPYLAQVDSKMFGIAVVTTDNQVVAVGDVKVFLFDPIDIQSVHACSGNERVGSRRRIPEDRVGAHWAGV